MKTENLKTKANKISGKEKFQYWTIAGVSIVAISSFLLSFDALRHLALANGISGHFAFLFPLSLDLAILIYSMASLVRRQQGLKAGIEIAFVITVTLTSVILNMFHDVENRAMGMVVHTLPPLFLAASFETLSRLFSISGEVQTIRSAKAKETRKARALAKPVKKSA